MTHESCIIKISDFHLTQKVDIIQEKRSSILWIGSEFLNQSIPALNTLMNQNLFITASWQHWEALCVHTCSWGLYHSRRFLRPESAGTAERSDLAAVCWDPCDPLAWSPITVATKGRAHQPKATGTSPFLLSEPPCTARPLWTKPKKKTTFHKTRQIMKNPQHTIQTELAKTQSPLLSENGALSFFLLNRFNCM